MMKTQHQKHKTGILQFSTFRVAGELFGVEAFHVQEILPFQKIVPVPLAPDYIRGLMNLRGQIVTVLDLRRRLGLASSDDASSGANVIVNMNGGMMSILVDEIDNIFDVQAERLLPPPGNVRGVAAKYIRHVCQLEDELLIILDMKSVLAC